MRWSGHPSIRPIERAREWRGGGGGRLSFAQGTVTSLTATLHAHGHSGESGPRARAGEEGERERRTLDIGASIHPSIHPSIDREEP